MSTISSYMCIPVLLIFLVLLDGWIAAEEAPEEEEPVPKSLYGPNDYVLLLDVDNFNERVYHQKQAFFVEFFSSWCGACIAYAETYKTIARELVQWGPVVQIAAVDCAMDRNLELCREHSVDAYPTIKYFKYMSLSAKDGLKYNGEKYKIDVVPLELAQLVQQDWAVQKPKEWPSFETIDSAVALKDIWQNVPDNTSLLAVIAENYPPKTAWAVMIAFAYDKRIHVVQVRNNHPDALNLGISPQSSTARLFLLRKGQTKAFYVSGEQDTWIEMQDKIVEHIAAVYPQQQNSFGAFPNSADKEETKVTWSQFEVQMVDIMTAVHYMFMAEIPRKTVISGENLIALKQWIHAMKMYAPGTIPVRRLFYRLDKWISGIPKEVTAKQWLAKVKAIQEDLGHPIPNNMTYMACRGSRPHFRGFSCGIWTLIHVMSVQAYELEKENPKYNANSNLIEPFHLFIWRFFSCSECAQHFHEGILKRNMTAVVTPSDGVLWLWRTHNVVNKFLAKTPTDDPAFPKQQFPPASLCSTCRNADGEFDEEAVLKFMISYYRQLKIDGLQSVPGYKVSDFENGKLINVEMKHLHSKLRVGAFNVDKLEEVYERLQSEHGYEDMRKDIGKGAYGRSYGDSLARQPFYVLWLSIIAVVVLFIYLHYRRNRSKIWKTFYYCNDHKL